MCVLMSVCSADTENGVKKMLPNQIMLLGMITFFKILVRNEVTI